jgi:predicted outer membrane repeat protein
VEHWISVPPGTYTLTIANNPDPEDNNATGDLDIRYQMMISGAGPGLTIIQAGTNDSDGIDRVFHVVDNLGIGVTIQSLTVRYGNTTGSGGGIYTNNQRVVLNSLDISNNHAGSGGGGIYNAGGAASDVRINHCTIRDNTTAGRGGGINTQNNDMTVEDSTLSGNSAGQHGGGLYNAYRTSGYTYMTNCTVSGNQATGDGGGLAAQSTSGGLNLNHVTITGNTALGEGGGVRRFSGGVDPQNTIVAGNDASTPGTDDCLLLTGSWTSQGYNLVGSGTGCPTGGTGDRTTTNPRLGGLAENGGPTQTCALLTGSPALDQIPASVCGTTDDQRGVARPQDGSCDIGAYEGAQAPGTRYVDDLGTDASDCTNAGAPCATVAYAIGQAAWGDTVQIDAGTYTEVCLTVDKSLVLDGAGVGSTIVQAAATPGSAPDRVFNLVNSLAFVTLQEMTVRHGNGSGGGGGIAITDGWLAATDLSVEQNSTDDDGGGLHNAGGYVELINVNLSDNYATAHGGGLANTASGRLTYSGGTLSSNNATGAGGGLYASDGGIALAGVTFNLNSAGGSGGGLYNYAGDATLTTCTFSNNGAGSNGGGIYKGGTTSAMSVQDTSLQDNTAGNDGGGIYVRDTGMSIDNSTLSGNSAGRHGGGLYNGYRTSGHTYMTNCTVSGNKANRHGGGLAAESSSGSLTLNHVTVTTNTADWNGGNDGDGGGIRRITGPVRFKNTIITGNDDTSQAGRDDCYGTMTSQGYNLVGSGTGCPTIGTDQATTDALLDPLTDNGGETETHALLVGSPAVERIPDGVSDCAASVSLDQRGVIRAAGFAQGTGELCDVGAYEYDDFDDPTLVELVSFTAVAQDGIVHLEWQTASEVDHAGFNLWRSEAPEIQFILSSGGSEARHAHGGEAPDSQYTRRSEGSEGQPVLLNAALIPALGGPALGAAYAYDDASVVPGATYHYEIEIVDVNGGRRFHGPVEVQVPGE